MSLGDHLPAFERRLADLESHLDNAHRIGFVTDTKYDSDLKRWYVKIRDNESGSEGQTATNPGADPNFQSDWLPWQTFAHGTISVTIPPRKGQSVAMKTPNGRPEMAYAEPFHNNPANPSTSDKPDVMAYQVSDPKSSGSGSGSGQGGIGSDAAASKHVRQEVSSNDKTVTTPGVTQTTDQDSVSEAAKKTMTRSTGSNELDGASSFSSGNAPHELNAQLQGLRAEVTQHTHHIAALHDVMSKLNTIAITKIPQLAVLQMFLGSEPANLKLAADGVLGKLESYVSFSMQQAVAKLTNSFMGSVMGIANGALSGNIGSALSQITGLAGASDAAHGTAPLLAAAQQIATTLVPTAPASPSSGSGSGSASGSSAPAPTVDLAPLNAALQPIVEAFNGTASADDVSDIATKIAALSPATAAGMVTVDGLMAQLASIYDANAGPGGLSDAVASALAEATSLTADASSIDTTALAAALAPVAPAFSKAASNGQATNLLGQITGIAGAASGLLSGLGGMTDAQEDITKGMIKSYRLGGYGGSS